MIREQPGPLGWAVGGDVGPWPPSPKDSSAEVRSGGAGVGCWDSPGISQQRKASIKKVTRTRPPPPDPCVATRNSCKQPAPPCCDPCASCMCRFFRSSCSCRVLNRNC